MSELRYRAQAADSLWHDNPVLRHLFGLTPLLALSTTLIQGITLLVATSALLLLGSGISALLTKRINANWRFVFHLLMLAVLTTLLAMTLGTWNPLLAERLGLYLPLLCCSFVPLLHLHTQPPDQRLGQRLADALRLVGGYGLAVLTLAALREGLTYGRLLSDWSLLSGTGSASDEASLPVAVIPFAATPAAGLLLLAMLAAAAASLRQLTGPKQPAIQPAPAPRARVTEKLQ